MLHPNTSERELKVYELYLGRLEKQYDLVMSHFRIYLGFNAGAVAVLGFFIRPYFEAKFPEDVPTPLLVLVAVIAMLGMMFAAAWVFVGKDDRKWQLLINEVTGNVEESVVGQKECALLYRINEAYPLTTKWPRTDVLDINIYVAWLFFFMWVSVLASSLYFMSIA